MGLLFDIPLRSQQSISILGQGILRSRWLTLPAIWCAVVSMAVPGQSQLMDHDVLRSKLGWAPGKKETVEYRRVAAPDQPNTAAEETSAAPADVLPSQVAANAPVDRATTHPRPQPDAATAADARAPIEVISSAQPRLAPMAKPRRNFQGFSRVGGHGSTRIITLKTPQGTRSAIQLVGPEPVVSSHPTAGAQHTTGKRSQGNYVQSITASRPKGPASRAYRGSHQTALYTDGDGATVPRATRNPASGASAKSALTRPTRDPLAALGMQHKRDPHLKIDPNLRMAQFLAQADGGELGFPGGPTPAGEGPFEIIDEEQDLTVILRRSKLMRTKVDIYRTAVVDPTICDVIQFTPREISIIGKQVGATHVTFWFKDNVFRPVTYLVKVIPDPEEQRIREDQYGMLQEFVREAFPDSKVLLVPFGPRLLVKGQAKDSEEAARILEIVRGQVGGTGFGTDRRLRRGVDIDVTNVLGEEQGEDTLSRSVQVINLLTVPGVQQVALKVKIAELNRAASREFGVDIDAAIDLGEDNELIIQSLLNAAAGSTGNIIGSFSGGDIEFAISYLQQRGVIRLLSEPTLVTMSGRPATFLAGGEFAVPTAVGVGGIGAVTTTFRSFGAIISFVPIVIDKDRIRLEVAPEFSQIDDQLQVGDTPGLQVRSVATTVEMREGQTLAIAGLLDTSMTGNSAGDLPFLAKVLGRRTMATNETEILILVTPELVHPMDPEEVPPLPGFDVTEPNNTEFFLHGDIEGTPTMRYRSTIWPRLRRRYKDGAPAMISGPFGHGQ